MALRLLENAGKVPLRLQSRLPSAGSFGNSPAPSAAQCNPSVENTEQVGGDLVDRTVSIDPEKKASLIVPRGQR